MNRSEADRVRAVRGWLEEGSTELSARVRDGVLREFPGTTQDRPFWSSRWPRMNTFATVSAVAVGLVVVVVGARLLGGASPGGGGPAMPSPDAPSPTPYVDRSYRDVGFIGLPPLGATPSSPRTTVLVESFWVPAEGGGLPYRGGVFLYADGRLIWNEYFDGRSTGWLEQRLTSEGIDLVRGLAFGGGVSRRLYPALLPTELPANAWADARVRPYVPSGFAACLFVSDPEHPFTIPSIPLSEALPMLPMDARDLLHDREPVPTDTPNDPFDCRGMNVVDARRLDAVLRRAGLDQDEWRNGSLLEYHIDLDGDGPETWWLNVWFEPFLPDGSITCSSCG